MSEELENNLESPNILDIGAITGNWPKNISYSSKDRIRQYYGTITGKGATTQKHSFFYEKRFSGLPQACGSFRTLDYFYLSFSC